MRSDARRSFRIQTPEHRQRGTLLFGKRKHPVLLLNTSAVGFALLSPQPIRVQVGAVARLQADDAWYEVLVIRQEETEEGFLIGAERLADIKGPNGTTAGRSWLGPGGVDSPTTASTAVVIVGVGIIAVLSAYLIAGRPSYDAVLRSWSGNWQTRGAVLLPEESASSMVQPPTESRSVRSITATVVRPDSRLRVQENAIAARQRELLDEEMSAALKLTNQQKKEIARLLQSRSADETEWDAIRQDEAGILQILTPKQIAQWRAISSS